MSLTTCANTFTVVSGLRTDCDSPRSEEGADQTQQNEKITAVRIPKEEIEGRQKKKGTVIFFDSSV